MLPPTSFVRFGLFPNPYNDELLYSILARLRRLLGDVSTRRLLDDAFGATDRRRINVLMPQRLQDLADRIPGGAYSVDHFVRHHTVYPYVARFVAATARQSVYNHLQSGAHFTFQGVAKAFRRLPAVPHVLAFCPTCVRQEVQATGQASWHRVHQLPLVFRCPEHGEILRTIGTPAGSSVELICCPCDPDAGIELPSPLTARDSLRIAEISTQLLTDNESFDLPTAALLASRYRVADGSPMTARRVSSELERDLEKRFGRQALEAVTGKTDGFAKVITRGSRSLTRTPAGAILLALLDEI